MYPYIVCFCGRSLGDLYDVFKAMRSAKYRIAEKTLDHDIDPTLLAIAEDLNVNLLDVFEALRINMMCCRDHIATQVEFKEYY